MGSRTGFESHRDQHDRFVFGFFSAFFLLLGTSVWAPFGPQSGPHPPSAEPPLGHHGTWSHEKEASAKMVQYDFVWVATHLPNVHGSTISVRLIDPNLYHKLNSTNVQLMYACRCEWKCEVVRSEIRDLRLFSSCPIDVCLQMQMEVREIRDPKLNVFINVRLMFP